MSSYTTSQLIDMIKERLAELEPTHLEIIDDSDKHRGHAAHEQGARHFTIKIQCDKFDTLSRVQRHRLVYSRLEDLMPAPIHALAIQTTF